MAKYPIGFNFISISGTVGNSVQKLILYIQLIDPCPGTFFSFSQIPLHDTIHYIEQPQLDILLQPSTFIKRGTPVDCGPYSLEIFNDDTSALDPFYFAFDSVSDPNVFSVKQ